MKTEGVLRVFAPWQSVKTNIQTMCALIVISLFKDCFTAVRNDGSTFKFKNIS